MQTMKKQFFLFYLVLLTIYLIGGALQSAGASPHPLGRDKTHSHGVIDSWAAKRYSDQYQNRRYADLLPRTSTSGNPRSRG